jgi:CHRD domain-containing protein
MPKPSRVTTVVMALTFLVMSGLVVPAMAAEQFFSASLQGGNETPVSISTTGTGVFGAVLDPPEGSLQFQLHYRDLVGGDVVGAHIHLGQRATSGGIVIHFCGTGGKPACPPSPNVITGVVTSADVVAVGAQGVTAGDFSAVVRALRRGDAYVNVHTATFPSGEIRGQVQ